MGKLCEIVKCEYFEAESVKVGDFDTNVDIFIL
jgi:hypothetical protein